ncbi:MAG: hypothetical protein P9L91_01340, partial [Candidatus Zophobacter franzmannii]|nr:hypothetical protein [Candidatus Zophobacter franzmannii]
MIKKAFILSILLTTIFFSSVASTNDWETFTNTTHIFDVTYTNNQLSIASWGGLDIYQKDSSDPFARDSFERIRTINNINGLGANDIRALAYSPETESYWLSVYNKGINILNSDGKVTVIDEELLGLPSNKVSKIILDGLFYVATDGGLGIYQTHEDLSFPLLLSQYTVELTSGGLVSDNILDLVLTKSDYLVMATNMGISYVHRDSLSINSAWNTWDADNSQLPDNMVTVLSTKDDILAIGTKSGAFVVTEFPDSLQSSVITEINSNMFPPVSTIFIDSYNKLWLSFGIWDEDSMIYTDNIDIGIANMSLTGVIEATWGLGDSGLDILNITSFKEIENKICATTWGEGVLFYEDGVWVKLKTDCIGFNAVKSIKTDSDNKTWFSAGTYGDYMTKKGT